MKSELLSLMNVGKAVLEDLMILGIINIKQLAQQDPDEMYKRLCKITGKRHDPCMWDVFAAIIHEAKTGEKTPWWNWTKIRKSRNEKN
ncbi:MAG: Mitomycin resistance protein mcrB [Alphaproteobacteria bacterium]|nr:MAG: Mitomycin resistance protein mcrB [Alphaproteobacteria bacterium]